MCDLPSRDKQARHVSARIIRRREPGPAPHPALAIIARLSFRKARAKDRWGNLQVPHEYTVRKDPPEATPEQVADYFALYDAIQASSVEETWGSRRIRRRYLYVGDGRKYWAMTVHKHESRVLNRMLIEDDVERLRKEGQPVRDAFGQVKRPALF
jgi:hypothetical protein